MTEVIPVELALQLLISLAVAIVSAKVTVALAFKQFLAERWWERKADAYASILQSLHVMKRRLERDFDDWRRPNHSPNADDENEQRKRYQMAQDGIYQAVDTGSFLLSIDATTILHALIRDLAKAESDNTAEGRYLNFEQAFIDEIAAVDTCLKKLPEVAKRDLRIPSDSSQRRLEAGLRAFLLNLGIRFRSRQG